MQHRTFSIKHTWFFIPPHVLGKQQFQVVSDPTGLRETPDVLLVSNTLQDVLRVNVD